MKTKIISVALLIIILSLKAYGQWPGYFYAFELKDAKGNVIDSSNTDYKMTTMPCCTTIVTGIKICEGNKTWHFYAGGNSNLDKSNSLKIERMENGSTAETMIIEFPATL